MSDISFREIKNSDCEEIFRLGKKEFGSPNQYSWDWSISTIRDYVNKGYGTGIICQFNEKIIGFALAQNQYSKQKPNTAWFTYILINPKFQGKGLGKELLERTIELLKKKGIKEIMTDVYAQNKESLEFFKRKGFGIKEKWFILARTLK